MLKQELQKAYDELLAEKQQLVKSKEREILEIKKQHDVVINKLKNEYEEKIDALNRDLSSADHAEEELRAMKNHKDEWASQVVDLRNSLKSETDKNTTLLTNIKNLETSLNELVDLFNYYDANIKESNALITHLKKHNELLQEHLQNKVAKFNSKGGDDK